MIYVFLDENYVMDARIHSMNYRAQAVYTRLLALSNANDNCVIAYNEEDLRRMIIFHDDDLDETLKHIEKHGLLVWRSTPNVKYALRIIEPLNSISKVENPLEKLVEKPVENPVENSVEK